LPPNTIYLDGNSLGLLPKTVANRLQQVIEEEWGTGLISSWNQAGWMELPQRVGAQIARLVGANSADIVVGDSTSVNLFKCLGAAVQLRPQRRVIVAETDNFSTDTYMAEGLAKLLGNGYQVRYLPTNTFDVRPYLDETVAVVLLTHVHYKTAAKFDIQLVTQAVHDCGALMIWDLSHSTGAMPVQLATCQADFAVGCTYKYLNGGPGSPAFVYASPAIAEQTWQPLSGWLGHSAPFAFETHYRPNIAVQRFIVGTPHILSLSALHESLKMWEQVDLDVLRQKSLALTDLFIQLLEQNCAGHGLEIITPRQHEQRGSHVSVAFEHAYPVVQALIDRGVIGDFRAPNIMRFGFAPLYVSFQDVVEAVAHLQDVLASREYLAPQFQTRKAVT
jgi:kynureninase